MGFLKNLFGDARKETDSNNVETEKNTVYAPLRGNVIPLKEIGDGVFSEGVLGQGCGIEPDSETVTAPFNGTITQVADTKHAVGLESTDGVEVLIHVGMDTVSMNGKGFTVYVKTGDKIQCGQKLMSFSKKAIAEAGFKDTAAVIITNTDDYSSVELLKTGAVTANEKLIQIK